MKSIAMAFISTLFTLHAYADSKVVNTNQNIQGIYFTQKNTFYTLEIRKQSEKLIYINDLSKRSVYLIDREIGHQGFGVYRKEKSDSNYLITGDNKNPYSALLFKINNTNNNVRKKKIFLFPENYSKKNETMPTFSSDGKFIIARGRNKNGDMVIRIFDSKIIIESKKKTSQTNLLQSGKYPPKRHQLWLALSSLFKVLHLMEKK